MFLIPKSLFNTLMNRAEKGIQDHVSSLNVGEVNAYDKAKIVIQKNENSSPSEKGEKLTVSTKQPLKIVHVLPGIEKETESARSTPTVQPSSSTSSSSSSYVHNNPPMHIVREDGAYIPPTNPSEIPPQPIPAKIEVKPEQHSVGVQNSPLMHDSGVQNVVPTRDEIVQSTIPTRNMGIQNNAAMQAVGVQSTPLMRNEEVQTEVQTTKWGGRAHKTTQASSSNDEVEPPPSNALVAVENMQVEPSPRGRSYRWIFDDGLRRINTRNRPAPYARNRALAVKYTPRNAPTDVSAELENMQMRLPLTHTNENMMVANENETRISSPQRMLTNKTKPRASQAIPLKSVTHKRRRSPSPKRGRDAHPRKSPNPRKRLSISSWIGLSRPKPSTSSRKKPILKVTVPKQVPIIRDIPTVKKRKKNLKKGYPIKNPGYRPPSPKKRKMQGKYD